MSVQEVHEVTVPKSMFAGSKIYVQSKDVQISHAVYIHY